jgi:dolichol-phosphate mannosyltransferase
LHGDANTLSSQELQLKIAVVIPCYRVKNWVVNVINRCGPEINSILVVDDACPEKTGAFVRENVVDSRVQVIELAKNQGVGGAVIEGYKHALELAVDVVVKIDGDGQMAPELVPQLIAAITAGKADYCKGNRFHHRGSVRGMPLMRLIGNAGLSFFSKLSSGYWQSFDPTNGFTAIHRDALTLLPLDEISRRYFFESDVLFHLGQIRAVVHDVPMHAQYAGEPSSLRPSRVLTVFVGGHLRNLFRRIWRSYFIHGFSLASLELFFGCAMLLFGLGFGANAWVISVLSGVVASAGTVMLAGLPIVAGLQLVLSWLNFDVQSEPRVPVSAFFTFDKSG